MLPSSQLNLHNQFHISQLLRFITEELAKHSKDNLTSILEFAVLNLSYLHWSTHDSKPTDFPSHSEIFSAITNSYLEKANVQSRSIRSCISLCMEEASRFSTSTGSQINIFSAGHIDSSLLWSNEWIICVYNKTFTWYA